MTVGERIEILRIANALSREQLAERSGISASHIKNVEYGEREPSHKMLIALAPHLNATALVLLTGEDHAACPFCGREEG